MPVLSTAIVISAIVISSNNYTIAPTLRNCVRAFCVAPRFPTRRRLTPRRQAIINDLWPEFVSDAIRINV
jgi:hypothetical protein